MGEYRAYIVPWSKKADANPVLCGLCGGTGMAMTPALRLSEVRFERCEACDGAGKRRRERWSEVHVDVGGET